MFKEKKWSNRIQLILLFVIFSAPLVGAYAYHAYVSNNTNVLVTDNNGEFYPRPQDLADIPFTISGASIAKVDGSESNEAKDGVEAPEIKKNAEGFPVLPFNSFDRRWYLIVPADQNCAEVCAANLEKIAYIRVVHARYAGRIISMLAHNGVASERVDELQKQFALTVIESPSRENFQQWLEPFYQGRGKTEFDPSRIYMVDPSKKLMMSYPADATPLDIYDDMKRLLKTSRVG